MRPGALTVYVNGLDEGAELDSADVERAVELTAASEGVESGEISVTFLDEAAISELNRSYLGEDGPTDVIAFNLGEPHRPLGDIYICPEIAQESAAEYDVDPAEELLRLVVHGTLHLFGYDHPEGPDRSDSEMFRRQEAVVARLL